MRNARIWAGWKEGKWRINEAYASYIADNKGRYWLPINTRLQLYQTYWGIPEDHSHFSDRMMFLFWSNLNFFNHVRLHFLFNYWNQYDTIELKGIILLIVTIFPSLLKYSVDTVILDKNEIGMAYDKCYKACPFFFTKQKINSNAKKTQTNKKQNNDCCCYYCNSFHNFMHGTSTLFY